MKHIHQLKSTDRLLILGFTRQKSKMAAIFCLAQTSASFLSHFHVKTMWYKFFVAFKDHLIWHTFSRLKAMWHITRVLSYVKTMWFHRHEWIGISRSYAQICDCWLVLIFVEFWIISVSACLLFPKFGRELFFKTQTELESRSHAQICDYRLVVKLLYPKAIFSYFIVFYFVEFWIISVSVCLLGLMHRIRTWTIF